MLALKGTYYNGNLKLEKEIKTKKPLKVIITFIEAKALSTEDKRKEEKKLKVSDFSFLEAQNLLKNFKGSLSQTVIEERKSSL